MALTIEHYNGDCKKWDNFVLAKSVNGTFLQTRNFLEYHPAGRFEDVSLVIMQGTNIVAVIPACCTVENGKRCFFSHKGSTFGGIIIDKEKYNISVLEELFPKLEEYLKSNGFESVFIRNTSSIFAKESDNLFDYFFYKYGYITCNEISFFVDCSKLGVNITDTWTSSRRRGYKHSLRQPLMFRKIETDEEVGQFYDILVENLENHKARPVHTLDELIDFKNKRLSNIVSFYGVYHTDAMIAGAMLFAFEKKVLHAQYFAQRNIATELYAMNFLDYNLIQLAKETGYSNFSFGIATEDRGRTLNVGLAMFKEGFGAEFCINRSYEKEIQ